MKYFALRSATYRLQYLETDKTFSYHLKYIAGSNLNSYPAERFCLYVLHNLILGVSVLCEKLLIFKRRNRH